MDIIYLNTDLELRSRRELSPILSAFGRAVSLMYNGKAGSGYLLSVETQATNRYPDRAINRFCDLVESLSKVHRKLWGACQSRILDIGFDSGTTAGSKSNCYRAQLSPSAISRAAKLGMAITITIYPVDRTRKHRKVGGLSKFQDRRRKRSVRES